MTDERARNRALLIYLLLPTLFLSVALLGGLRVAAETGALLFFAPPLVTLVLAVMLVALFARGGALRLERWLSADNSVLENVAHALTLGALLFASAQAFNSVLPERGLLRWLFSFFFLWTLWQNQFVPFDARRPLRGLMALFDTAFLLKHALLASLYSTEEGGWLKRLAGFALEGITLGTLDAPAFAPATGYVSFFALALYVAALALLPPAPDARDEHERAEAWLRSLARLAPAERERVREALMVDAGRDDGAGASALPAAIEGEAVFDKEGD